MIGPHCKFLINELDEIRRDACDSCCIFKEKMKLVHKPCTHYIGYDLLYVDVCLDISRTMSDRLVMCRYMFRNGKCYGKYNIIVVGSKNATSTTIFDV